MDRLQVDLELDLTQAFADVADLKSAVQDAVNPSGNARQRNSIAPDLAQAERNAQAAANRVRSLNGELAATSRNTRDVSNRFRTADNSARSLGDQLRSVRAGAVAAAAAVTTIAVAARQVVSEASQFDAGLREIVTLSPDTLDLQNTTDIVRDLRREVGIASSESIPALYSAISAGVPGDNALDFLVESTRLASAGVTDLNTSVGLIQGTINAYGSQAESAEDISRILFSTVQGGVTTLDQLGARLGDIVPTAAGLNIEFAELNALVAASTRFSGNTARTVTGLNTAFAEFGDSTSDVSQAFEDLNGNSIGEFLAAGGSVREVLETLTEAADGNRLAFANLFGSEEARRIVPALLADDFALLDEAISGTNAALEGTNQVLAASELNRAGFAGQSRELAAAFQEIRIQAGEALLPVLTELSGELLDFINGLSQEQIAEFQDEISSLATEFIGVADDIRPLISSLTELAISLTPLIGLVSEISSIVTGPFRGAITGIADGLSTVGDFIDGSIPSFGLFGDSVEEAAERTILLSDAAEGVPPHINDLAASMTDFAASTSGVPRHIFDLETNMAEAAREAENLESAAQNLASGNGLGEFFSGIADTSAESVGEIQSLVTQLLEAQDLDPTIEVAADTEPARRALSDALELVLGVTEEDFVATIQGDSSPLSEEVQFALLQLVNISETEAAAIIAGDKTQLDAAVLAAANQLGVIDETTAVAALGADGTQFFNTLNAAFDGLAAFDAALRALNLAAQADAETRLLIDGATDSGGIFNPFQTANIEQYAGALDQARTSAANAASAIGGGGSSAASAVDDIDRSAEQATRQIQDFASEVRDTIESSEDLARELLSLDSQFGRLQSAVSEAQSTLDAFNGAERSAFEAGLRFEESIQGIADAFTELDDNGNQVAQTLDRSSEAGRDNITSITDAIRASQELALAKIAEGDSYNQANDAYLEQIQTIRETAADFGVAGSEVEALIDLYGQLPSSVAVDLVNTTTPINDAIANARDLVNTIDDAGDRTVFDFDLANATQASTLQETLAETQRQLLEQIDTGAAAVALIALRADTSDYDEALADILQDAIDIPDIQIGIDDTAIDSFIDQIQSGIINADLQVLVNSNGGLFLGTAFGDGGVITQSGGIDYYRNGGIAKARPGGIKGFINGRASVIAENGGDELLINQRSTDARKMELLSKFDGGHLVELMAKALQQNQGGSGGNTYTFYSQTTNPQIAARDLYRQQKLAERSLASA